MVHSEVQDRYTAAIALFLMAFVVSPVGVLAVRPASYVAVSGALGFSLFCSAIAWTQWKWRPSLSAPSMLVQRAWAE